MANRGTTPVLNPARYAIGVLKGLIWAAFVLVIVCLAALVFNFMPYALAPFYVAGILSSPSPGAGGDAIEGRLSDSEIRSRIAQLRALTASPQAGANSAQNLTIVGIKFDDLRALKAEPPVDGKQKTTAPDALARPYPMTLDMSQSEDTAIVTVSDPSIAWNITPPDGQPTRALFGIESRLLPVLKNAPAGVLAGFRVGAASGDQVAKPVQPADAAPADRRRLCRSIMQWANYFSVPIDRVNYLLVEDPSALSFTDNKWTSDGTTLLSLGYPWLRDACIETNRSAWK